MAREVLILGATFRGAPKNLSDQDEHDFNGKIFKKLMQKSMMNKILKF